MVENKKIRNATVCKENNLVFRSKQEKSVYNYLVSVGITPEYEPMKFTIWNVEKFTVPFYDRYGGIFGKITRKPTAIHYTPDFVFNIGGKTVYLEVKGFANDVFPYKAKLFRDYLEQQPDKENLCYAIIYSLKDLKVLLHELQEESAESNRNTGKDTP